MTHGNILLTTENILTFEPLSHQKIKHHTSCQRLVHQGENPGNFVFDKAAIFMVKKNKLIWLVVEPPTHFEKICAEVKIRSIFPPGRDRDRGENVHHRSWRWVFVPLHWTTLQVQPRVEAIGIHWDPWDVFLKTYMKCLIFYGFHVRFIYHTYMDPMGNAQLDQVCDIFDAFGNARRNLMQEICLLTGIGNPYASTNHECPLVSWNTCRIFSKIQFYQSSIFKPMSSWELCLLPYFNYSTMFLSSRVRQEATEVVLIWFQLTKDCLSKKSPNHINKNLTA